MLFSRNDDIYEKNECQIKKHRHFKQPFRKVISTICNVIFKLDDCPEVFVLSGFIILLVLAFWLLFSITI